MERNFGLRTLKKIRKRLYKIKEEEGIMFVHGIGKRKSQIQKSIETLEGSMEKLKEYTQKSTSAVTGIVILKQIRMLLL